KLYGRAATEDAFKVCERTLFRWQRDAVPKSRVHRSGYQKRVIHPGLKSEIIRLRGLYPRLGKEKLTPLLAEFCGSLGIPSPSEPTVGRMLAQLKAEGTLRPSTQLKYNGKTGSLRERIPLPQKKKLRRSGYLPELPGDLVQLDGVLVNTLGQRRYTFTAVDLVSRWAFSKTYKTASSRNGADFLHTLLEEAPFKVRHIQTDNGSEFMKEFREAAEAASLIHFFNWVKQPKYQGWVERFNRTIQESFLDWHRASLAGEPDDFNLLLDEWLHFYNTKRVHRALGRSGQRLTPLQYLALSKD
ncbi:MAG: DDE-type integrase/transposase/recombinase, partial [bacterium]|nr:DDE-type integrase/transposase/recombinase [bacterium]